MTARYALTLWQPHADLAVTPDPVDPSQPIKPVENRTWPPPSTLPQWTVCLFCATRPERRLRHGHQRELGDPKDAWSDGLHWHGGMMFEVIDEDSTPFPFRLGIHAGKKLWPGWQKLTADPALTARVMDAVEPKRRGVLVGFVTVTAFHRVTKCVRFTRRCLCPCHRSGGMVAHAVACCVSPEPQLVGCSRWADVSGPNVYHWQFTDPEPLDEPIPMRGRQRLWPLPAEVTA